MDRIQLTPSPASTYCSVRASSQRSPVRRSQRLIDKENRDLKKILLKSSSPQLFGNSEDDYTQLLLQQDKVSKAVQLKSSDKVVRLKYSEENFPLKPSNKVDSLMLSNKIIYLKRDNESKKLDEDKNQVQKADSTETAQAKPKKRGRKPKKPAAELQAKLQSTDPGYNLKITPPSKLPVQYPAHFVHQLPPAVDSTFLPLRPLSAPSAELRDLSAKREDIEIPETYCGIQNKTPSEIDSDISMNFSLSDSIGEIFGTKDISSILTMQRPRQYILIEEHLPAMATMLNVDLERLRSVMEITQGLSHEQILGFSIKQEVEEIDDKSK
ncbi:meiotic recombination protein P22 [Drosophila eugracilis]|uniref:meiotic recombination protein P22 n=1 Tax=Drosophila eugracilis TaxID=29029 RepID=UPI0007E7903D|nr:meiotic recombination protein P22 [Drosophila eugracilis]